MLFVNLVARLVHEVVDEF
jgi:class 3 adenylate cyclase